mmetsp:Transcript_135588/g.270503  ORF Transcript_135588/g.270503 Transcript_135588/m.270503 type:complete len:428 (+) Transcript_135588:111-1394(+)
MPSPELVHRAVATGPPSTHSIDRFAQEADNVLAEAEAALARLKASQHDLGRVAVEESDFLTCLANVRDAMVSLLRDHHCGKPVAAPVWGEQGDRLQRARALLSVRLSELNGDDPRLRGCVAALDSMSKVVAQTSTRKGSRHSPRCTSSQEPSREVYLHLVACDSKDLGNDGEEALRAAKEHKRDGEATSTVLQLKEEPAPQSRDSELQDEERMERPEFTFPSGGRYRGQWRNCLRDGHGVQSWPDGEMYEGQFIKGGVQGEGVYSRPDGMRHTGQWEQGKQHGQGTEEFPDGTKYVGQYFAGAKSGRGTYTFSEGSVYEGEFLDNNIHGVGAYIWTGGGNGRKYSGQWACNQMHGQGEFTFADGRRYNGEYKNDQKHGSGTFTWPDGREYEGQWRQGKQHGDARYRDSTGEVHQTQWVGGSPLQPTL